MRSHPHHRKIQATSLPPQSKEELNPPSWQSFKNGFSEQQMPPGPFPPGRDLLTGALCPQLKEHWSWTLIYSLKPQLLPLFSAPVPRSALGGAHGATPGWSLFSPAQSLPKENTDPKRPQIRAGDQSWLLLPAGLIPPSCAPSLGKYQWFYSLLQLRLCVEHPGQL